MIAEALIHGLLVVFLGLRDGVDLGGAGFAGERIGGSDTDGVRRAVRDCSHHPVDHELPLLGGSGRDPALHDSGNRRHLPRPRVAQSGDESRPPLDSAGGQDGGVVRHLQGSGAEVSLAYAQVDRLTGKPHLVRGVREGLGLPFLGRQQSRLLPGDVDAGELAEAERRHELGDAVDAQQVRDAVEVDVAGVGDRFLQIQVAVRLLLVGLAIAMGAARQIEIAGAIALRIGIQHMVDE